MTTLAADHHQQTRRHRTLVITSVTVIVVDLATKVWASSALRDNNINLPGPLDLRLGYNRGVAFGFLNGAPTALILVLTGAVTVGLALAAWRGTLPALPAGLILGGAIANVLDRAHEGSVVDMLHSGWWPTFNLADTFLTIGCMLLIVTTLLPVRKARA